MPPLPAASEPDLGQQEEEIPAEMQPLPPIKKGSVEVVALRPGVYKRDRKAKDDKFRLDSFEQLGSWMRCVDPVVEKKHQETMIEKKKRAGR